MSTKENFYLSDEASEWIGQKKSEYLSKLIQELGPDDFQIEDIYRFEQFVPETISAPDRTYEVGDDTYPIRTYVRSYQDQEFFFQVVIGGVIKAQEVNDGESSDYACVLVPFLIFVTKKESVVKVFGQGRVLDRSLLS